MSKSITRAVVVVTTLVVVGGALIYSRYSKDINAARARISSGSQVVNTACGPIEYGEYGKGPPLLMVHGSGGGFDQGLDFARTLVPDGYRVIVPSRFGYLRTPLPADASPMAQALGARFIGYQTGGHLLLGHRKDVSAELSRFLAASSDRQ